MYDASTLSLDPGDASLLTDLYQLTMAACYRGEGIDQRPASFELFTRRLPAGYNYLVAMGLEQALAYLETLHFSAAHIEALQSTGIFAQVPDRFWDLLAEARFTGDVWAVAEGTVVFAHEPLLRIEAPLWQAQLVETYLLNTLNYQTLIATRAARLRQVAGPAATLLEFGSRRAFSPQGALWAARAALAGGLDATSNVAAALKLGQRPSGTMAHAWVMALSALKGTEDDAFEAFHRYFPGGALLIDTYDAVAAAQRLAESGQEIPAVRLDSGDLVALSQAVRSRLPHSQIWASGDLDELEIARLKAAGACFDGYGLGTRLVTGTPVNGVYKLVEIDGIPVMKESPGKMTYPGKKQIFRCPEPSGLPSGLPNGWSDVLGLVGETVAGSQALLQKTMQAGQRLTSTEAVAAIAQRTAQSVATLAPELRQLDKPAPAPLTLSPKLLALTNYTRKSAIAPSAAP